ncbi:hypothetical protein ACFZBU_38175 [Embleya sp. NPDC008237]
MRAPRPQPEEPTSRRSAARSPAGIRAGWESIGDCIRHDIDAADFH